MDTACRRQLPVPCVDYPKNHKHEQRASADRGFSVYRNADHYGLPKQSLRCQQHCSAVFGKVSP